MNEVGRKRSVLCSVTNKKGLNKLYEKLFSYSLTKRYMTRERRVIYLFMDGFISRLVNV